MHHILKTGPKSTTSNLIITDVMNLGCIVSGIARGVEKLTGGRISGGGSRPVLSTGRIQMQGGRRVRG
jgi:hypothetical protein